MARRHPLSFQELRVANLERCNTVFHPVLGIDEWGSSDWAVALAGEVGEACDVVKKMRRKQGAVGRTTDLVHGRAKDWDSEDMKNALAQELADVIIYADLLAARNGIDLGAAVIHKFNLVSGKVDSDVLLDE